MRIPKGVMKIAMICNKDEDSMPETRSVNVARLRGKTCRAETCDGRSAIRIDFEEPESEMLPGFGIEDEPIEGFVQLVPAEAALDADAAIGKECQYLIVDEDPPDGAVRVVVPQAVNQMWDGKAVAGGKFPPLDKIIVNPRLVATADEKEGGAGPLALRVALNPKLLNDTLRAIVAATDCEGVFIDVPLKKGRPLRVTPLMPGRNPKMTALLMPMNDDTSRRKIDVTVGGELLEQQQTFEPPTAGDDPATSVAQTVVEEFAKASRGEEPSTPEIAAAVKSLARTGGGIDAVSVSVTSPGTTTKSATINHTNKKAAVAACDRAIAKKPKRAKK